MYDKWLSILPYARERENGRPLRGQDVLVWLVVVGVVRVGSLLFAVLPPYPSPVLH